MTPATLSIAQARHLALRAQGLAAGSNSVAAGGTRAQRNRVVRMVAELGAVQLDTISVLARSHELVAYSRLGALERSAIEAGYWSDPPNAFEYWSHAACILPLDSYPWFGFRRREFVARGYRWHDVPRQALKGVLKRLAAEGPLTANELGGAKAGAEWWNWSETKIAVEWLWDIGEVVVTRRVGWRRVYDLAERALPASLLELLPDDRACLTELVRRSGQTLGVGTTTDLADVHRLSSAQVRSVVAESGLVPVTVEGWPNGCYADPAALRSVDRPVTTATALLSPFDSLVWNRARTARLFGLEHRLEAYTPAAKRIHGYFAMPVLHKGELIARVDPGREGSTLVAKHVTFEVANGAVPRSAISGVATALKNASSWIGSTDIRIDRVTPDVARKPLLAALAR